MNPPALPPRENLTLTAAELAACHPVAGAGGQVLRAWCPFHGSDRQRSLRVQLHSGRFVCFACGAWGYLDDARERWQAAHQRQGARGLPRARGQPGPVAGQRADRPPSAVIRPSRPPVATLSPPSAPLPLVTQLAAFQAALPGSRGATYLQQRGIPLPLAQQLGVGYAAPETWPHAARDWRGGRVVFPHTTPEGTLVNLYGRAVDTPTPAPKSLRHAHLPGGKGYFHAAALHTGSGPLWVCEGVFDALALLAAGVPRVVALFGIHGWRWEWVRGVGEFVVALDADPAGHQQGRALARAATLRGKRVALLGLDAYGGYKDVSAAWAAGALTLGTGLASLTHLPHGEQRC